MVVEGNLFTPYLNQLLQMDLLIIEIKNHLEELCLALLAQIPHQMKVRDLISVKVIRIDQIIK